jgi:hypothetical protein
MAKKIKTWEEAQLSKDDVIIGVKIFDCYMVDAGSLKPDDPILAMIGKARAPGFYSFQGGKLLYKADGMPKSSAIYACLKKTVSKVYKQQLDKLVRKVQGIEKEIEKVESRRGLVQQKLARLEDGDREKEKVLAELETLLEREKALKSEIDMILDLENTKEVSKR